MNRLKKLGTPLFAMLFFLVTVFSAFAAVERIELSKDNSFIAEEFSFDEIMPGDDLIKDYSFLCVSESSPYLQVVLEINDNEMEIMKYIQVTLVCKYDTGDIDTFEFESLFAGISHDIPLPNATKNLVDIQIVTHFSDQIDSSYNLSDISASLRFELYQEEETTGVTMGSTGGALAETTSQKADEGPNPLIFLLVAVAALLVCLIIIGIAHRKKGGRRSEE